MRDAQWDMVARTPGTYLFPVLRKSPPHLPTRIQTSVLLEERRESKRLLRKRSVLGHHVTVKERQDEGRINSKEGRCREARAPRGFQLELSVDYGLNKDRQHRCEPNGPVWTHRRPPPSRRGEPPRIDSRDHYGHQGSSLIFFFFLTVWYSRLPHKLLVFFFWFILIKDFKSRGLLLTFRVLLFLAPWLLANGFLNTILIISFLWNSPFFITAFAFVMCTISWLPITRL